MWLKAQRLDAGLTIRTLADKLGVPHSVVGKIEDGSRKVELFEFIQFCQVIGIDPLAGMNDLLKEIGKAESHQQ